MIRFKNIRRAAKSYRAWRAQGQLAKEAQRAGKKKKHKRLADQSKRDFLVACGRAAIIPGVALAGGLPMAYYLLTKKSTPKRTEATEQNGRLKGLFVNLLNEVRSNKSMSPRYHIFIKTMISLIETERIRIKSSPLKDMFGHYDSDINTLEINPEIFSLRSSFPKSIIIHELFHAYHDYQKKVIQASRYEAEAYLAQADYLFHHNYPIHDGWLVHYKLPESVRISFNVPISFARNLRNASLASPEYLAAIKIIAENYGWSHIFNRIYTSHDVRAYSNHIRALGLPLSAIKNARKESLTEMRRMPPHKLISIDSKGDAYLHPLLGQFIGTSRALMEHLWNKGMEEEVNTLLNKTFEQLKSECENFNPLIIDWTKRLDG